MTGEDEKPAPAEVPAPARTTRAKAKAKADDVVARAGGYVDRGDGNGWVLEEE